MQVLSWANVLSARTVQFDTVLAQYSSFIGLPNFNHENGRRMLLFVMLLVSYAPLNLIAFFSPPRINWESAIFSAVFGVMVSWSAASLFTIPDDFDGYGSFLKYLKPYRYEFDYKTTEKAEKVLQSAYRLPV